MDVVAAGVVELDEEVRALDAKVVRLTRLIRSSPADADRIEWSGARAREPRFGELRLQVIGERTDQFEYLCLLRGVHLRERQPHGIQRLCTGSVAADDVTKRSRVEDCARPLRRSEARKPLTGQILLVAEQPKAFARRSAT